MLLMPGNTGSEVKKLQQFLNSKGYNVGAEDGEYGNKTKVGVAQYQKKKGILVDGWAGNQTLGLMFKDGLSFELEGGHGYKSNSEILSKFKEAIKTRASEFVGLIELKSNATWDDPNKEGWQKEKNDKLLKYMKQVQWWTPGSAYCIAFSSAIIIMALEDVKLNPSKFKQIITAHVMTDVRKLKAINLLSILPSEGSIWMARHGSTDTGHAGIVIDIRQENIVTIEGNTSAGPTADEKKQRNGDGIWERRFDKSGRGELRTQGFLTPLNILNFLT